MIAQVMSPHVGPPHAGFSGGAPAPMNRPMVRPTTPPSLRSNTPPSQTPSQAQFPMNQRPMMSPPNANMGRPLPSGQQYQFPMGSPSTVNQQAQFRPMSPSSQPMHVQPSQYSQPLGNAAPVDMMQQQHRFQQQQLQPQQQLQQQQQPNQPQSNISSQLPAGRRRAYPEQIGQSAGSQPMQPPPQQQQQLQQQPQQSWNRPPMPQGGAMDGLSNQMSGMNIQQQGYMMSPPQPGYPNQPQQMMSGQQMMPPPPQQGGRPQPQYGAQPSIVPGLSSTTFTPDLSSPTGPHTAASQANTRSRIDPNQIPSPVAVQEVDQLNYYEQPYRTCSKQMPPLASSDFLVIDEGNCSPRHIRATMYNIPTTEELLIQSMLPFGLVVQPLAELKPGEAPIECIDMGDVGPVRCRRCKAYINPFMTFIDGGRKIMCNFCQIESEVSAEYFCNLDMSGRRVDILQRPELRCGSVEYIASKEYIAKDPLPLSYVIAIDVSWSAAQSGMLRKATECLRDWLYGTGASYLGGQEDGAISLPGLPSNARVAIITYDRSVHFYNLTETLGQHQMMVVPDVDDMFVPLSTGFLVNPYQSRGVITSLLEALPNMFAETRAAEACIGAVAQAVVQTLKNTGGRLILMHTSLPSHGPGTLKNREDPKVFSTDKERQLYAPQDNYYKKVAEDAVNAGVCIDLFLLPTAYCDIATLGILSILTGGETIQFPNFMYDKDGFKLHGDFKRVMTRQCGYNALMRVRTSNNLKVVDHYGNFFTKDGTDIELAGIDADKAFGIALKHDGKLDERHDSAFQVALLYTTAAGQRRIRVHTLCIANTSLLGNVFRFADMDTTVNFLAKAAMSNVLNVPLRNVRDQLTEKCVKVLSSYRKNCASTTSPGQLILPESFKLFPVFTLALHKSRSLRAADLSSDMRVQAMRSMKSMSVEHSITFLYPRMLPLHNLPQEIGRPDERTGRIRLPNAIRISYERLDSSGIYLLENGQQITIWIGRNVTSQYLESLFGATTLDMVDVCMRVLPALKNPISERVRGVVNGIYIKFNRIMSIQLVRQGLDSGEIEFMNAMVEDKNNESMSYVDYLCYIHKQIQNEIKTSN